MLSNFISLPIEFHLGFWFTMGLLFGSFGNVLILRVPEGENIAKPRSRCPKCKKQIAWYDNVPVFSWIVLRAKCRHCKNPISWRYPLVELITGIAFASLFYVHGYTWLLLEHLIFVYGLIVVSFIDLDHMLLPDVFTLPGIVIGLVGAALNPFREFSSALTGVFVGGGILWLIAYLYYIWRKQEGLGGGDIKLLAWIGAVLGWPAIPFVVLFASITGSFVGLFMSIRTKGGMQTMIPFGPYLALGAVVFIFGGYKLGQWYINLFLPGLAQ